MKIKIEVPLASDESYAANAMRFNSKGKTLAECFPVMRPEFIKLMDCENRRQRDFERLEVYVASLAAIQEDMEELVLEAAAPDDDDEEEIDFLALNAIYWGCPTITVGRIASAFGMSRPELAELIMPITVAGFDCETCLEPILLRSRNHRREVRAGVWDRRLHGNRDRWTEVLTCEACKEAGR